MILLLSLSGLHAQQQKPKQPRHRPLYQYRLGTSLTYIWDTGVAEHQEYIWSVNVSWLLSRRLSVGLNHLAIWQRSPFTASFRAHIGGPMLQYKLTDGRIWDLMLESGLYFGNFCSCDADFEVPYKRNGLFYWPHGFGANVRLTRQLQLDLGFMNHIILNRVPRKYNFTQYIIGLDYFFHKR